MCIGFIDQAGDVIWYYCYVLFKGNVALNRVVWAFYCQFLYAAKSNKDTSIQIPVVQKFH